MLIVLKNACDAADAFQTMCLLQHMKWNFNETLEEISLAVAAAKVEYSKEQQNKTLKIE